jgi:hypothetical protein
MPVSALALRKRTEWTRSRWSTTLEYEAIRKVLKAAMGSGEEDTVSSAMRIINLFGERGDERYQSLLKLS